MRIWSVHPKYLDAKGLVALWRETLLAQKVLMGLTKGYRNHSQLIRFKELRDPVGGVATYLESVWLEAKRRNYRFDQHKINRRRTKTHPTVTEGQMEYEFRWLQMKLKSRAPEQYRQNKAAQQVEAHPLFRIIQGSVESWEKAPMTNGVKKSSNIKDISYNTAKKDSMRGTKRCGMHKLLAIQKIEDIPADFKDSPVSELLSYHNLKTPQKNYQQAELLIGMCMDNRKSLNIPENFAFIIRAGGANLRYSEFKVSFAIAVGGVRWITLIGHTQCGMVNLTQRKDQFVKGLCDHAGWSEQMAEKHFMDHSPLFEIGDEVEFILTETQRLALKYPKIKIAPLLYKVEDNLLYWITGTPGTT